MHPHAPLKAVSDFFSLKLEHLPGVRIKLPSHQFEFVLIQLLE